MSSAVIRFLTFYTCHFAQLGPLTKAEILRVYLGNSNNPVDFAEFHELGQLDFETVKIYATVTLAQLAVAKKKQEEDEEKTATAE